MAQQEELMGFFYQISQPLRIAVQREIFTSILREKNISIAHTIREIVSEKNMEENLTRQKSRASGLSANNQHLNSFVSQRMDTFLPQIVERLDISLLLPHANVLTQGDKEEQPTFYYVGKGDCKVTVKNARGKEILVRTLDEGDHFGEIALIYNCERTATVTSMNYNTFATMSNIGYKRLI